jgi:ketosteroid isomerase-like protein
MPNLAELSEGETALRAVERDWNAAAQHWNSAGLVALYTEDALFYGGRPGHAVGHAKVREYFNSYLGTFAAARLALVDQELRKLGEGVYLAQGYAAFDFDLTAGGATHCAALDVGSDASSRRLAHRPASFFVAALRTAYSSAASGTELNQHKIS